MPSVLAESPGRGRWAGLLTTPPAQGPPLHTRVPPPAHVLRFPGPEAGVRGTASPTLSLCLEESSGALAASRPFLPPTPAPGPGAPAPPPHTTVCGPRSRGRVREALGTARHCGVRRRRSSIRPPPTRL